MEAPIHAVKHQTLHYTMGKRTIAESVENAAILEGLQTMGADYAQSFGIARPVPLERVS